MLASPRCRRAPAPRKLHYEPLEPRYLLSADLNPAAESAILSGLNTLADWADDLDDFEQLASSLPVVGESIGQVLDFGQVLRDEFVTPVTDFLIANDPTDSDALVSGFNAALSDAGSPITLDDLSTADVFKVDVTGFDFERALEDVPLDFGEAAEKFNIDFDPDAIFDFVPSVFFGFDFGLDLDPALSPSEAFFFDVSDLDFAVETPESFVAGGGSDTSFDFTLDLGTLGDVSVTDGTFDLNAALDVAFTDPNAGTPGITLDELTGASLTSLLTVTPDAGNGLAAQLPLSATLASTPIGSATVTVALTGDVFGDFDFDVDLQGPDFQDFENFTNITPGDIVGTLAELGTQLQAITQAFDLPEGIPFVEDTLGELLDYASTIADLVDGLFDLGLQGAVEVAIGELTGQATFDVIVGGVTHAVAVPANTALADLVSEINADLPSGVRAELDDEGRLSIAAVDSAIETLSFANVNEFATDALGFQNEQTGIPLFDFVTWQEFEAIVDDFLAGLPIPGDPIALAYDATGRVVSFAVEFSKTVADQLSFNFNETIDLGVADLVLTGGASAGVSVPMEVRLEAGFDLTPLVDGTSLDDLNGGEGVEVTAASTNDLILVPSDGTGPIGVDLNGVTDVTGLKSAISTQTSGKVVLEINATQNGFVLADTTFDPATSTTEFMVSVAGLSKALPGLGFGVGLADSDGDGRLAGGEVLPRFFLAPFNEAEDTGSFATGGLSIAPASLSLSAALGFLEVGASGSSSLIEVFASSGLVDPDASGRIFLEEFGLDVVDVAFGPAPFSEFASGDVIGSFSLTLEFFDAETYGIDLAPADRTIVIALTADSPTFTPDIDLSGLPDLSTILENFQNLSIPQLLQLVGGIVEQLTDTPLFDLELPLLDQSINDLITLVSNQIDAIAGDFATLKADLEAQVDALETAINEPASLQAIGPDLQARLFAAVEGFDAAVEDLPTDFNIVFDANPTRLISALRALVDVTDEIEAVGGAVALFNNLQGALANIRDKVPSGDRLVRLLAEALGFDIKALTDTVEGGAGTVQDSISEAIGVLTTALQNVPDLGDPPAGLEAEHAAAQAALDDAVADLQTSLGRLNDAIDDLDIFAALRSVGPLTDGLAQLRGAIQTLTDAADPEFDDEIAALQSYLDGLLADVRDKVFAAFPLGALTFDLPDGDTLAFDVHFARSLTQAINVEFDLDVPGISDLVPLTFDGQIMGGITLGADFTAGFGIALDQLSPNDLSNLDQAFFINRDSAIALTAFVDIPDVQVTASIGGLKIGLGDAANPGTILLRDSIVDPDDFGDDGVFGGGDDTISINPAFLGLSLDDPDAGDRGIFFGEISAGIFQADLQATLLVNLPIIFNNTLLTENLFALVQINDFTEFNVQIDPPTELVDEILNAVTELSLENIIAGFRTFVELLKTGLQSELMTELPLVGDAFDFAGSKLNDLLTFVDDLETFIGSLGDVAEEVLEDLQQFFFDELGPSGINILALNENFDGVAGLTFADVPITFLGDITDPDALSLFDAGFQFDLSIGFEEMLEAPLDFGLAGLGLALRSDASVNLRLGLSLNVSFGVDRPRGFFLDLDNTGGMAALDVFVPQGDSLELELFFLNLSATPAPLEDFDHDGVSDEMLDEDAEGHDLDRDGTIGGMVTEPGDTNGDGILTGGVGFFGDATLSFGSGVITVTSFDEFAPDFDLSATADLDLTLTASVADNPNLPQVSTQTNVDWEFSIASPLEGLPDVDFNDITLDIGTFLDEQFGPVIEFFADFFQPLQPILDIVNTEIPVISDLSELLGAGPVTFGTLLELLGDGFAELNNFVTVLNTLNDIVSAFDELADAGTIVLGDLDFGTGIDFTNPATRSSLKAPDFGSLTDFNFIEGLIEDQLGVANVQKVNNLKNGQVTSSVGFDAGAFHFPVIDDPFGVVTGFLFGQNKDLVIWDIPDFSASFNFSQSFGPIIPPIPLFAKIFMGFEIFSDFSLGFNTRGLSTSLGDFANGFFFGDWTVDDQGLLIGSAGDDKLEFGVRAEAGASAELNVVIASAGVRGGVEAEIGANWNDVLDDGRFFLDELGQRLQQGIQCIFDLEGSLDAFFDAFVKLGFDTPFGFVTLFQKTLELVRVTLLDFSLSCPPLPIPQPASLDGSDIRLNIGPHAGDRQPGATDVAEMVEVFGERIVEDDDSILSFPSGITDDDGDGDIDSEDVEAFAGTLPSEIDLNGDGKIDTDEIRLVEDLNGDGDIDDNSVLVIGFGQWQIFNTGSRIVGDAGAEDDEIIFHHSVRLPGALTGGSGNDKLQGGQAADTIHGDDGEDVIIGGEGDDTLHGGGANDQIFGNAGSDTIHGDGGEDTIAGDNGDNLQPFFLGQDGEPTTSLVPLSQLADTIHGGSEGDNIIGEFGNDTIMGDSGPDNISGGEGDDSLDGGSEADLIEGNAGSDTIFGQAGDDILFGQADGIADGTDGDDTIDGGLDDDTIRDDFGADTLIGGFDDDFIVGGIDNDIIFGDLQPNGAPPAPPSGHGNGRDEIWGDRDPASPLSAQGLGDGADYIEGGGNEDTIRAGAGGDRVIGGGSPFGDGNFGGTDAGDLIFGEAGNDIIAGDNATIGVVGDVTSTGDVVTFAAGGAGPDTVRGGSGLDIIFGGGDDDDLRGDDFGGTDQDIVVGDQGTLGGDQLVALHSDVANSSGDDEIVGFGGRDILIGGDEDDLITGNAGDDVMLGDNAVVTFASATMRDPDDVVRIATSEPMEGGDDNISGSEGADIAFGGTGDDTISGGGLTDASDILFGDNGVAVLQDGSADENDLFSTDPTHGGTDTIFGGAGGTDDDFASGDIIVGGSGGDDTTGTGGDSLFGQGGADVIIGDNARILRSDGASPEVQRIETIFATDGGDDLLDGDAGKDVMLGGFGLDTLLGDDGDDIELGDNGFVDLDDDSNLDTVDEIATTDFQNGHADLIFGNSGNDIAIGGTAGDTIYGDKAGASATMAAAMPGADTLLGDQGQVLFLNGMITEIRTTDSETADGGVDTIEGNENADIIMGGVEGDMLFGEAQDLTTVVADGAGADTILGDEGEVRFNLEEDEILGRPDVEAHLGGTTVTLDTDPTTLDRITTTNPTLGGQDTIYGNGLGDTIFGGTDKDKIWGDSGDLNGAGSDGADGDDLIFGDHGKIFPTLPGDASFFVNNNFFAIDTAADDGGDDDVAFGNGANDIMLGQQGDDILFGQAGDDDIIGGHNVVGGIDELDVMDAASQAAILGPDLADFDPSDINDVNDVMDSGAGDDVMAGDNAIVIRTSDSANPRFRTLTDGEIYSPNQQELISGNGDTVVDVSFSPNISADGQLDPNDTAGRLVTLLDHSATIESTAAGSPTAERVFGNDVMAAGADDDEAFGGLGDDIMQGDGAIEVNPAPLPGPFDPTPGADPSFEIPGIALMGDPLVFAVSEQETDGDDYMEGNGGNDRMYGNLGQDDLVGGSSTLFGLEGGDVGELRPDGADLIYGASGQPDRLARNADDTSADQHGRDADVILGDNANVYRLVAPDGNGGTERLAFNYDGSIIPRAVELVDYAYALGFDGATLTASFEGVGKGDLVFGEAGDDIVHGMTGDDVLFGGSENDDLYGEIGADWISAGTGQDGILGDDGLIFTSRNLEKANPADTSLSEPLYGIAKLDETTEQINTPGNLQREIINLDGELKKSADLIAFRPDGLGLPAAGHSTSFNDILYGGLGSDWMHAGFGDDAMSGAEALAFYFEGGTPESGTALTANQLLQIQQEAPVVQGPALAPEPFWFDFAPYNPGDVLRFEGKGVVPDNLEDEFALYDENNPRSQIKLNASGELVAPGSPDATFDFLLNFDPTEGPLDDRFSTAAKPTDGADAMFGDLGNDWIVGGTGRDNMFGGRGDDLLNMDDDHSTTGGLNNAPDPFQAYADYAFGGAGRDVLILNTGVDRAIDWNGEFNSYVASFAPFGAADVSRGLLPQLDDFLYDLSAAAGADQTGPDRALFTVHETLDDRTDAPDPTRNFEPYGELGLVDTQDFDFGDQQGPPNDPQAGGIPGGERVIRVRAVTESPSPLRLATGDGETGLAETMPPLAAASLDLVLDAAIDRWSAATGTTAEALGLSALSIGVTDLTAELLGLALADGGILIDSDAAGQGWFVDPTPEDDGEFRPGPDGKLLAKPGSDAFGRVDLLTAVMHEVGHVLGKSHDQAGLMADTLAAGTRLDPIGPEALVASSAGGAPAETNDGVVHDVFDGEPAEDEVGGLDLPETGTLVFDPETGEFSALETSAVDGGDDAKGVNGDGAALLGEGALTSPLDGAAGPRGPEPIEWPALNGAIESDDGGDDEDAGTDSTGRLLWMAKSNSPLQTLLPLQGLRVGQHNLPLFPDAF